MTNLEINKRKSIHTLINIGLIAFLIFVGTIGMRGLSASSIGDELSQTGASISKDKIMVCAIGQCLFI
ncbi:MAG: hypothetical protein JKY84_05530 [Emcibacteraceae bacterium]|nr:hypothetical protein [Emcibacteraceae bacterium]